jgi:hypothetical protein
MDPYIEQPHLWLDFHNDLAAEIRSSLNRRLDPRYVARLPSSTAYEVIEIEVAERRSIVPDVTVLRREPRPGGTAVMVPTITPAPAQSSVPWEVPVMLYRVEIITTAEERLVTVIEILSPSNKRRGHDSAAEYLRKRRDVLRSSVHLIEIDLLRGGDRPPLEKPVPVAPYYVTVCRENLRPTAEVWPIQLNERLPTVPVPLLEREPDVPLDLPATVASVYERGAYERQIDYREPPPPPPLSDEETKWLDALLREKGLR